MKFFLPRLLSFLILSCSLGLGVSAEKAVYEYTGNDRVFTVPVGVTEIKIKAWGAGGGSETSQVTGGPGGYTEGLIPVQPGDQFLVVVGQGGTTIRVGDGEHYKFVGATFSASQGGSMSGVFLGTEELLETQQDRAVVIAGGGGGSIQWTEEDQFGGSGNAQSAGVCASDCVAGSMRAGLGTRGFGSTATGGSGYQGGGENMDADNLFTGGTGFVIDTALEADIQFTPDSKQPVTLAGELPPNTDDPDYVENVGRAREAGNGHGLVVIEWEGGDLPDGDQEITCNDDCEHELENFEDVLCVNLTCTADSPAQITATLTINGEIIERTKRCDKEPPVCTATFPRPFEWHRGEDFPIECLLSGYADQIPDARKAVFRFSEEQQLFTVPEGVTEFRVKIWGAGSAGEDGVAGDYATGVIPVEQEQYLIVVGTGGDPEIEDGIAGHSGVFTRTEEREDALILAPGGGQIEPGICDEGLQSCENFVADGVVPPANDNQDYREEAGVAGDEDNLGKHGLIVIEWADEGAVNNDAGGVVVVDPEEVSETCTTVEVNDGEIYAKTICEFTNEDQKITVPEGVHNVRFKAWGAGGGGTPHSDALGGGGGFAEIMLAVAAGEEYAIVVGEGGEANAFGAETYGFGAGGGLGNISGASGGGLSGVFMENVIERDSALIVAGGGGGSAGTGGVAAVGGDGGGEEGDPGLSSGTLEYLEGNGGRGGTQTNVGIGGDVAGANQDGVSGAGMEGGQGGNAWNDAEAGYGGGGGGGGGFYGGGGGNGDTQAESPDWTNDAGGGGGSGFCHAVLDPTCDLMSGINSVAANTIDPEYVNGIGDGGQRGTDGGHGLVVIEWLMTGQCLVDPGSVEVVDPLEPAHGDVCVYEVCDLSGNCATCQSPELKFDDTAVCKSSDQTCRECAADDDDCWCIKGDASKCRDGGPINCYTNPFHERCPGFQNPACLIDPFTPGCPVVNPCYPVPVYDGLNCPKDAIRFCARNPYHYGCNIACKDGAIACSPDAPPAQ